MKKIVINLSDFTFEKLRFEAIKRKKNISTVISERILHKPFQDDVEMAFENWVDQEIERIIKE